MAVSVRVTSKPLGEYSRQFDFGDAPLNSDEVIQLILIDTRYILKDTIIEVESDVSKFYFYIDDDAKRQAVDVVYVNRNGTQQVLTFFGDVKTSVSIDRETYLANTGYADSGIHNHLDINIQGRKSITLESGFVYTESSQAYEDLLLSEYVWLRVNETDYIPVNIDSKQIAVNHNKRTQQYTVKFKKSYNEINTL